MKFLHEDFLLQSPTAKRLYHEVAEGLPIIDYHCHLPPADIAGNKRFANLFEIWLQGDHYKWRAMRSNGVPERLCTGDADPREKFDAWCATVPHTIRNPLYHWSHLELSRHFGIDCPISSETASEIWDEANRQLALPEHSVAGILKNFRVETLCTTDDPADDLANHTVAASLGEITTQVLPTFRPDMAMKIMEPIAFNEWCDRLATVSSSDTSTFQGFIAALRRRHDFFHKTGCRLSDHGLETCPGEFASESEATNIFEKARTGGAPSLDEQKRFAGYLMILFGHWDSEKGWTKQLHLGAQRGNNTRALRNLGPDTGFDSIGDYPQIQSLARYLDRLECDGNLPRTILYNLNPADNYAFATMIGNFQDGSIAGKIQFGSGWWFLDQKHGIEMQLDALSSCGLLSRFVGMLTDSRSFMSYPRHEYFRRVLCNVIGGEAEQGLLPNDRNLLDPLVKAICYENAKKYFGFPDKPKA